jgi:signal transduction histidine kinase
VSGAVSVFRDITREKEEKNIIEETVASRTKEISEKNDALEKAQKEISQGWLQAQREKARLTASINSLPIGFVLTDKDNAVFMINSATKKILNITTDVYHTDSLQEYLGESCKLTDLLRQTQDTKAIIKQNDILIGTNYINITIVPILLETDNEFLGSAIVTEDITERKITERARDEFFSIASHELRTPLTAIRGNTAMIIQYFSKDLQGNKELTEMIEDIHKSSVRLIAIVNDFLNVSRLEMKKMSYKKSPFNIKELAEKVNKELEPTAQEKHDTLEIHELTSPLPQAFADPDRTKEVLLNLVGNAVKFTDGGVVKIDISVVDSMLHVQVTDSGLGIPKERWDLLFRKFQQAGENIYTRDTSRSSGLGLYISRLMIEEMGGKIGLERSEVNKGSTFLFTLPVATPESVAASMSSVPSPAATAPAPASINPVPAESAKPQPTA